MSSTIRGSDNFNSTLSSTLGTSTTNTMHQKAISDAIKFGVAPTHTADATFTGIDNKIVMTGIVTALQLEVGDVIQFSNALEQNNKARTVESITDADTIIVNYEHCGSRGNGSLKLTDETVVGASVKLLSKWYNAPIGLGQDYVDVSSFITFGVQYQSLPNREMVIIFNRTSGGNVNYVVRSGDTIIYENNPAGESQVKQDGTVIIKGNSTYMFTVSGAATTKIMAMR